MDASENVSSKANSKALEGSENSEKSDYCLTQNVISKLNFPFLGVALKIFELSSAC